MQPLDGDKSFRREAQGRLWSSPENAMYISPDDTISIGSPSMEHRSGGAWKSFPVQQPELSHEIDSASRMDELDVLHDVATRLEEASIPYMLTGSMALNYYAEPRMTRDIDLVIDVHGDDVSQLVSAFQPEYYVPRSTVEKAVQQRSMFNLIHRESVLKIDFILRKATRYREVEFDRRQRVQLGPAEVYVVRKEDLIISKIAWAEDSQSDVQKRDVRNLMATDHDEEYLEHWLKELHLYRFAEDWLE